jgi:hypothetical protein
MGSLQNFYPESGYLSPSSRHRRAMWATGVALACGIIGGAIGLLSLMTGHQFDFLPHQAAVEPGFAELSHDFATLEAAGTLGRSSSTPDAGNARAPEAAKSGNAASAATGIDKRCAQSTWPFVDNECPWGKPDEEGRRKRIVSRLKSPWCSGLHSKEGAYICRPRT